MTTMNAGEFVAQLDILSGPRFQANVGLRRPVADARRCLKPAFDGTGFLIQAVEVRIADHLNRSNRRSLIARGWCR